MDKLCIKEKIEKILSDTMKIKVNEPTYDENDLINSIGINSIDALEIFINVENEFDIQIEDEDLSAQLIASIDNIIDYVSKKYKLNKE